MSNHEDRAAAERQPFALIDPCAPPLVADAVALGRRIDAIYAKRDANPDEATAEGDAAFAMIDEAYQLMIATPSTTASGIATKLRAFLRRERDCEDGDMRIIESAIADAEALAHPPEVSDPVADAGRQLVEIWQAKKVISGLESAQRSSGQPEDPALSHIANLLNERQEHAEFEIASQRATSPTGCMAQLMITWDTVEDLITLIDGHEPQVKQDRDRIARSLYSILNLLQITSGVDPVEVGCGLYMPAMHDPHRKHDALSAAPFDAEAWIDEAFRRGHDPIAVIQQDGSRGLYMGEPERASAEGDLEFNAALLGADRGRRLGLVVDRLIERGAVARTKEAA